MPEPSDIVIHNAVKYLSLLPSLMLEWAWGELCYTERSPDIWKELCETGSEVRKTRVPLEFAKQLADYQKRVPGSIHILYPPGDNYAIVVDYTTWMKSAFRRRRAILECQRSSDEIRFDTLREHRYMRMSIAICKELGRRIPNDWFYNEYRKRGEEGIKFEIETLEDIMKVSLYIPPSDEEKDIEHQLTLTIETTTSNAHETNEPKQITDQAAETPPPIQ